MELDLEKIYRHCELCERRCGTNRRETAGYCGETAELRAAKAMLHYWEEPAITGGVPGPSGAVFFSGCNLRCVFCQNYQISHEGFGKKITAEELSRIFLRLQEEGAKNIDLVTPVHFLPDVVKALRLTGRRSVNDADYVPKEAAALHIPVVFNCGGYENVEVLKELEGYVDFWLPDVKYFDDAIAVKYSSAPHYFETAVRGLSEMIRQARALYGEEAKEKVIVRHMVLPGCRKDSIRLLEALAGEFGTESFLLSLMSQYTPFYRAAEYKEISRKLTTYEYTSVLEEAVRLGFSGFMQEKTSAKEEYTPAFDLSGL